jgi:uncharacterized membrane protein
MSSDGQVVVGYADGHALRWDASTGVASLIDVPGTTGNIAYAADGNGSVVVGSGGINGTLRALRWTPTGAGAIDNPPGAVSGMASSVSADGSVLWVAVITTTLE